MKDTIRFQIITLRDKIDDLEENIMTEENFKGIQDQDHDDEKFNYGDRKIFDKTQIEEDDEYL